MAKKSDFGIRIKFETRHLVAICIGLGFLMIDFFLLRGTYLFAPVIVVALTIGWLPYWLDFFMEIRRQKAIESQFPDFVRNLVGAIKSGMPVSKAIVYVAKSDYGHLDKFVKKMAHQIEWSIPVHKAFINFSRDIGNPLISRTITTVIEAEKSGGNIEDVLGSITYSLISIKKLKQERKAAIQGQITQSYVIFFIFLAVLITIQNLLIPYISKIESSDVTGSGGIQQESALNNLQKPVELDFSSFAALFSSIGSWFTSLTGVFTMLALIQAFFAGVVLGKLAEGDFKSGLKHSFIMMTISLFIMTIANSLLANSAIV
ncbi:MAG: type II secretion system F family protein [Candidatus Woesearchaeota archaeon]